MYLVKLELVLNIIYLRMFRPLREIQNKTNDVFISMEIGYH